MSARRRKSLPAWSPTRSKPDVPGEGQRPRNPSRRRFLAAASTPLAAGAASAVLAQEAGTPPAITRDVLASAQEIAGVSFTDAERDLMLRAVATNREHFEELRAVPLGHDVEPAIAFRVPARVMPAGEPSTARPETRADTTPLSRPATDEDLAFASVHDLKALLRARVVTSTELTRLALDRLQRFDGTLHCVVTLTPGVALAQAARADAEMAAGRDRGPLHGIPYGLKDLVATRGIPTTWGAKPFEDQTLDEDATVYERLREAGAVLVAKLATGELAIGDLWFGGRTRNPWNPERGSNGSSAGPAAATAAGLVPFAIGTETNGSIISPSSTCGVTGLRPTYGRVSRCGVMALRWTLDKVGVIARTAEDTALVLEVIHGADPRDETSVAAPFDWRGKTGVAGLRLGIAEHELAPPAPGAPPDQHARNTEYLALVGQAIEWLREAGAVTNVVRLPPLPARAMYAVCNAEAGAAFDDLVRSGRVAQLTDVSVNGRANQLRTSRFIPAVEYLRAQRVRTLLIRRVEALLSEVDALVTPSDSASVTMTNFTGHPAMSLNCGFARGLPVGLMLTGRYFDEATLVRIARAYQQSTAWHRQRPHIARTEI